MIEILYFKSVSCNSCKKFLPVAEAVTKQLGIKLLVIDVADHPLKAMRYRINSLPTIIIEKDGEVRDSLVGAMTRFSLEKRIKNSLRRG